MQNAWVHSQWDPKWFKGAIIALMAKNYRFNSVEVTQNKRPPIGGLLFCHLSSLRWSTPLSEKPKWICLRWDGWAVKINRSANNGSEPAACILSAAWWYTTLSVDDMQFLTELMICTPYGVIYIVTFCPLRQKSLDFKDFSFFRGKKHTHFTIAAFSDLLEFKHRLFWQAQQPLLKLALQVVDLLFILRRRFSCYISEYFVEIFLLCKTTHFWYLRHRIIVSTDFY